MSGTPLPDGSPPGGSPPRAPLVIVSNRLPVTVSRTPRGLHVRRSPGGLVAALEPALQSRGGTWVGWPGTQMKAEERLAEADLGYAIRGVNLTDAEVNGYYHGCSNRTLWPLFHCFPGQTHFERGDWESYERVNARFAAEAALAAGGSGLLWVHDYHLMLVPSMLQAARPAARIAFFLHVPFPPYDIFRLLPWDREILRGLLAADLIGFHTRTYVGNFLDCAERLLGARVDREACLVEHGDRTVRVEAFPLGIDFASFDARARTAAVAARRGPERIVLGVDRLDYTKGIPERILAFERLFELHPQHREKVVLLQIAEPSRVRVPEYNEHKRRIDELVGRVNGRLATAGWSPIRYLYRSYPPEALAALYRDADVAMVTPLRDGMNLVAKEFVACQVADPGVLVLSRLAGAAETMRESVLVNPYNLDATAEALHRALTMDEDERRSRMAALRRREMRSDVGRWTDQFLAAAHAAPARLRPPESRDFEAWLARFLDGCRVALFLDYDGTLVPLCDQPDLAVLSADMRRALDACAARRDIDVVLVSGRALGDLMAKLERPGLTYAANHGLEIVAPDLPAFRHPDLVHFEAKVEALAQALDRVAAHGAWAERKGATLTFHYRKVEPALQEPMADRVRAIIREAGFQARQAHRAIEARPPIAWDKGHAVYHILRARYGPAWPEAIRVVYVGDDQTDEDAFRMLAGLGATFRVGSADSLTAAARRLPGVEAVRALLAWLAARPLAPASRG